MSREKKEIGLKMHKPLIEAKYLDASRCESGEKRVVRITYTIAQ